MAQDSIGKLEDLSKTVPLISSFGSGMLTNKLQIGNKNKKKYFMLKIYDYKGWMRGF